MKEEFGVMGFLFFFSHLLIFDFSFTLVLEMKKEFGSAIIDLWGYGIWFCLVVNLLCNFFFM